MEKLGQWLQERCHREHLSLRQAAAKTDLSHSTIQGIINGSQASSGTIRKLVQGFGGDGTNQRLALQDYLLVLAGYRTEQPEGEELSEMVAQLMDSVRKLSEPQVKIVTRFVEFLLEIVR